MTILSIKPHVTVKAQVVRWERVEHSGGFTNWTPTLECGHVHYGGFHPSGNLPLELDCYPCQVIGRNAVIEANLSGA